MGFTYDCYVTADQLERVSEEERARFCAARFAGRDQISAFGSLLEPLPDEELTNRSEDAYAAGLRRPPCRRCSSVYRDGHRLYRKDRL